jgi:hypothetical protein
MQKPYPPDYISSEQLATDHGIDSGQQLRLIYDGKLTGYRLTGKLTPFYPSMNPPYDKCENPKPNPVKVLSDGKLEGNPLPVSAKLTAEYRQIHATEAVALNKDTVTDLYYNKNEVVALKKEKSRTKDSNKQSHVPTKVQQRVREVSQEWLKYANDRREHNPSFSMAKVITLIQRSPSGQHPSGKPYAKDTIRKVIKGLFPSVGKKGRPPKR